MCAASSAQLLYSGISSSGAFFYQDLFNSSKGGLAGTAVIGKKKKVYDIPATRLTEGRNLV